MSNDMNDMLGKVLNDPQAMNGIMKIAQGLMNNSPSSDEQREEHSEPEAPKKEMPSRLPPELISGLPRLLAYDENRVNLLNALKPYLSEGRRERSSTFSIF